MPLIKNGRLATDDWTTVGDDDALPQTCPALITLERWQRDKEDLTGRSAPLAVRLRSDQSPDPIVQDLAHFAMIALEFPAFKDGRAFSYARLLRERYGYKGEIRAVGDVLRDQFLYMARCGFDAFEIKDGLGLDDWQEAVAEQQVFYQATGDGRVTALDHRHIRHAAE